MTNSKFNKAKNKANQEDYSFRTDGDHLRQIDTDRIHDYIESTNWSEESKYHNTYYNHKNKKYGTRTLKMKNKEWHKLNTLQNKEERDN